jgi:hypothetical protein
VRTRLKPRWLEERKIHYTSRPAPRFLQNCTGSVAQVCRVFMPQNAEASKQEGQKQTWHLASRWEVTTYHTSTRLQHTTSTSVKPGPSQGRELAFRSFPWISLS